MSAINTPPISMAAKKEDKEYDVASVQSESLPQVQFYDPSKESVWTRLGLNFESFKRAPGTTGGLEIAGSGVDTEKLRAENPMLQQKLRPRHLTMIAVGGSIGTGLFVGSGAALNVGGPAGVIICWILMGIMLINVTQANRTQALGEMCILYPVSGAFYTLANRFLDPTFAFAMGWNYYLQWAVVLPLEITVAGTTVHCRHYVAHIFPLAGTELVGLAASETPNPRAAMPGAVKGTFWRITLIYFTSLLIIGFLVPFNEPRLLGGGGAAASPFVIALDHAHIKGLNHFVNAVICVSVLSIGLSCVYAGSRTLTALGETGYAPKFFSYVDKSSRPLWSVIATLLFAPLAYINVVAAGVTVFDWLVALSGLSTIFTWMSICLCHIRFRMAWKHQGHSLEELPFQALGGVYGSYFGVILLSLVLIAQFYIALWPVGGMSSDPKEVASGFFRKTLPDDLWTMISNQRFFRGLPGRAHHDPFLRNWVYLEAKIANENRRNRP
ncbi:hypothetical protein H0H93_004386 [Arthromyces matolae]|nr:hypothetical protein H0H93_004386 [Arthromyces matolae]